MLGIGILVASIAAFLMSSVYYVVATPIERQAVGPAALDRGRPAPWKVVVELLRTIVVACAIAWLAHEAGQLSVGRTVPIALVSWVGFPLVLLSGSVLWDRVHPATAAMHAGDWLLKLLLIAIVIGLVH